MALGHIHQHEKDGTCQVSAQSGKVL